MGESFTRSDPEKSRKKKAFPVLAMRDTQPVPFEDGDLKAAKSDVDELDKLFQADQAKAETSRRFVRRQRCSSERA